MCSRAGRAVDNDPFTNTAEVVKQIHASKKWMDKLRSNLKEKFSQTVEPNKVKK